MSHSIPKNDQGPTKPVGSQSHDVARYLSILHEPGSVFEVRSLDCPEGRGKSFKSTTAGYFNYAATAAVAVGEVDLLMPFGIYCTLNPVRPDLIARAANRVLPKAKKLTDDVDILRRRWLPIDLDPIRPSGVSSTDAEMEAALDLADTIEEALAREGWPKPLKGMSGSGAYLLYRVDVANDDEMKELFRRVLIGFGDRFNTDAVHVDTACFNAARIFKVLGTVPRKGDDFRGIPGTAARPHRRSWFIEPESALQIVSIEQLTAVAAPREEPKPASTTSRSAGSHHNGKLDVDTVKQAARGQWGDILIHVGGLDPVVLTTKGNPCPKCHGNTRFDILDIEVGAIICRQCFNKDCGDGIAAVQWLRSWSFPAALAAIAKHLGMDVPEATATRNSYRVDSPHGNNSAPNYDSDDMDRFEGQEAPVDGADVGDPDEPVKTKAAKKKRRLAEPEPFPVETLPEPVRSYVVNNAESLGCCPSMVALPMLSGFAACIGNACVLQVKPGWFAKAILWTAVVAESGSLKSPAFEVGMAPFRNADDAMEEAFEKEHQAYLSGLDGWETAVRQKQEAGEKPKPPKHPCLLIDPSTNEAAVDKLQDSPCGLMMEKEELAVFIGGMEKYAGSNSKQVAEAARWLVMYNAGRFKVNRKTGWPKTIRVKRASLSITGGIQPGLLRDMMDRTNRQNGMMARWLFTYPTPRPKKWREGNGGDWLSSVHVQNVVNCLLADLQMARDANNELVPNKLDLSREARAEYAKFYNIHGAEHAQLTGDAAAMSAKLEEIPCRLALIFHCIKWAVVTDPDAEIADVDVETMRDAIRLAQWFKQEAERILGTIRETDDEADRRRLAEWIRAEGIKNKRGCVIARDLRDNLRDFRNNTAAAEAALRELARHGYGTYEFPLGNHQPGQPTRVFVLHSPSTATANSEFSGETTVPVAGGEQANPNSEQHGGEWVYNANEEFGEHR